MVVRQNYPDHHLPNSTVTPGLHTAGVVISSVGVLFILSVHVILIDMCCIFRWGVYLMEHISIAKEWLGGVRRKKQETEG